MSRNAIYLSLLLLAGCASQNAPDVAPVANDAPVQEKHVQIAEKQLTEAEIIAAVNVENSVFFPPSGAKLDQASRQRLLKHAARLKDNPDLQVTLAGHTDHLGSPSYNLAIAEQRINAVMDVLRAQRIPVTQIRRQVVGSEQVPANCKSPECRRKMRRVELIFSQ